MGAGLEVSYRDGWLFKLFGQHVRSDHHILSDSLLEELGFLEVQWLLNVECWHTYIRTASTSQSQCCVCRLYSSHYTEHFACVDFIEFLFLPYSFNRTGLGFGLIVFGLGITRHVWSRSWSQSRSHCVVVSLTSLAFACVRNIQSAYRCFIIEMFPGRVSESLYIGGACRHGFGAKSPKKRYLSRPLWNRFVENHGVI